MLIFRLNQFSFVFVTIFQLTGQFRLASSQASPMEAHGVVPDVIDVAPAATITVCPYPCLLPLYFRHIATANSLKYLDQI